MLEQRIQTISYLLGQNPINNGSDFNWLGKTREGETISLYYEVNKPEDQVDFVEFCDPSNCLHLPMDHDNIGTIKIMDLPKYFTRYHSGA